MLGDDSILTGTEALFKFVAAARLEVVYSPM